MKKFGFAFAIVAALVVAFMTTGQVFAQGNEPPQPERPYGGNGFARGMANGRGGAGAYSAAGEGILHDGMIAVYAQGLGISVDELNARLAQNETMGQIAAAAGLTAEQFRTLMTEARTQAVDQAVIDGTLTQEQAEWMKQRGLGTSPRGRSAGRAIRGVGTGSADCPYVNQTTP